MTAKKRISRTGRPDRYSKQRNGYVSQSLRLSVEDNKLVRDAASLDGFSINLFLTRAVVKAAKARIAKEQPKPEKEAN